MEPIGLLNTSTYALPITPAVSNGVDNQQGAHEPLRTPSAFKTASVTTAAATTLWTPVAGKRFRIMGFVIQLTNNAAAALAAVNTLTLLDGGSATGFAFDFYVPAAAGTLAGDSAIVAVMLPGNGYLSSAINNVLTATLSAGLTAGNYRINLIGCDE